MPYRSESAFAEQNLNFLIFTCQYNYSYAYCQVLIQMHRMEPDVTKQEKYIEEYVPIDYMNRFSSK